MKILNLIIEIIFSPLSLVFRTSTANADFSKYAKSFIVVSLSIVIVVALVLYFYRDIIFG